MTAAASGRTEVVIALLDRGKKIEATVKVRKYDVSLAAAGGGYT